MSRLDSFIRRMEAQRACLDAVMVAVKDQKGVILELGLGNGRTFDHLRQGLPGHEIFVFEREVRAHPDCVPDEAHLFLGPIEQTLPMALERLPDRAILAHSDIGTGDAQRNQQLAAWLTGSLPPLLLPDAWVVADQDLCTPALIGQSLPSGVDPGRYFIYRHATM